VCDIVPVAYAGTAGVTADGSTTVMVDFSPALPDVSCCRIALSGAVEDNWYVKTLVGDVDFDGSVLTPDASRIKARFQDPVTAGNFWYDVDADGEILTPDASRVKSRFQNMVPACP
jgi:hypothetical protein